MVQLAHRRPPSVQHNDALKASIVCAAIRDFLGVHGGTLRGARSDRWQREV